MEVKGYSFDSHFLTPSLDDFLKIFDFWIYFP